MTKKNIINIYISLESDFELENELKNEIDLCDLWLSEFAIHSNRWTESTSYHYKHLVESYFGTYISNDAFIISAQKRFESKLAKYSKQNYRFKFAIDNRKMKMILKKTN